MIKRAAKTIKDNPFWVGIALLMTSWVYGGLMATVPALPIEGAVALIAVGTGVALGAVVSRSHKRRTER